MPSFPNLPSEIHSRTIRVNDLEVHYLEALPPPSQPCQPKLIILLHGFPEIAYSWRKVIAPLSQAGFHVVAPDLRGFGWTKILTEDGKEAEQVGFDDDLSLFRPLNMVNDIVSLVYSLGYDTVEAVVGHDYGSGIAGSCALIRPDLFRRVVMMSAPYGGAPDTPIPPDSGRKRPAALTKANFAQMGKLLAALDPPRKHYTLYFSTPEANTDMVNAPQGLHTFLRAYFHTKSADWHHDAPSPLPSLTPEAFATLPPYYVMPLEETMPEAVGRFAPTTQEITQTSARWLPDDELEVYVSAWSSPSGFQGGLNSYRCLTNPTTWSSDLRVFAGKQVEVPAMFLAGKQDWGTYQFPGAVEKMKKQVCRWMKDEDFVLIDGAGHWVQQERPEAVVAQLLRFLQA